MEKKLKKLTLKKKEISSLTAEEMEKVTGGITGSRMMCFGTNPYRGCTNHTRCKRQPNGEPYDLTILCINW